MDALQDKLAITINKIWKPVMFKWMLKAYARRYQSYFPPYPQSLWDSCMAGTEPAEKHECTLIATERLWINKPHI